LMYSSRRRRLIRSEKDSLKRPSLLNLWYTSSSLLQMPPHMRISIYTPSLTSHWAINNMIMTIHVSMNDLSIACNNDVWECRKCGDIADRLYARMLTKTSIWLCQKCLLKILEEKFLLLSPR
jgi:hypothetical protein